MNKTVSLDNLSPADRKALQEQFIKEQAESKQKQREERATYKAMVDEAIPDLFYELLGVSSAISAIKTRIFSELKSLIEIKAAVYGSEDDQFSHSFTTTDGITIIIGKRVIDGWDDTVTAGIDRVNKYLQSLGRDENSRMLVGAIMKLLSKDSKGNLKASRVLQLKKMADDHGVPEFIDAVTIIHDAYRPVKSKEFVTCRYNDNNGNKVDLPLDITAAEFDFIMPAAYEKPQPASETEQA